jgi:hypothetical protein
MGRQWNWLPLWGFLMTVIAFVSYFFYFAYFPATRDFPWLNLLLFAVGLGLLGAGLRRAFGQPERYRGRISAPLFTVLSVAVLALFLLYNFSFSQQLPTATAAPRVGATAPDFTLPDKDGQEVKLSTLLQAEGTRWVLLVFYRGYW